MTAFVERYGPRALVAGAAEGLGAAWANGLAARGLDLVLLDRQTDPLAETARAIRSAHGVQVNAHAIDLGDDDAADRLASLVSPHDIGLGVYNAALSPIGDFTEAPVARASRVVDVNCRAMVQLVHQLLTPMIERRRGGVILVSSLSAEQGSPRLAAYAASKAFTLVFGESLWAELTPLGIDVLTIRPGAIRTPGWQSTQPDEPDPQAPPPMAPNEVVDEALDALGGDDPSPIIGEMNRRAADLMRQVPRRQMIEIMGQVTRSLRAKPTD